MQELSTAIFHLISNIFMHYSAQINIRWQFFFFDIFPIRGRRIKFSHSELSGPVSRLSVLLSPSCLLITFVHLSFGLPIFRWMSTHFHIPCSHSYRPLPSSVFPSTRTNHRCIASPNVSLMLLFLLPLSYKSPYSCMHTKSNRQLLKLTFSQYLSIHTNYIISHCTTL